MPVIDSKLPSTGTSIFTVMSAMATEHGAINLGQGFPDFEMDQDLAELTVQAIRNGHNQYAPMAGLPALREAIAEKVERLYHQQVSPFDEITITPGGTCAIFTALTTVLQPGDEVIVFEPAYDSYIPAVLSNSATAVRIPLDFPDYRINWSKVQSAINPKTKAIIINSPHNPTGSTLGDEDMRTLEALLRDTRIFVVSDEVYEHLVFDGQQHHSVVKYPELFSRSFVCFSFGKVYNCTGWKLGYCIAPKALSAEFRKIYQFNAFSAFAPAQVALATHLRRADRYTSLSAFMQQKRDFFCGLMKDTGFNILPCSGSYFLCATYKALSDQPAMDFAMHLTQHAGVASIPVSAFYVEGNDDRIIRFCFAKKEETLELAAEKLKTHFSRQH